MAIRDKKKDLTILHLGIMLFLMIVFRFIPPVATITPVGMQLVGVFLAMLYGWTFCGLLWPSLMGMIGLALSDLCTMSEFVAMSFGNETIVFILFLFFFTGVIDEVGLIDYIANKMISFQFLTGRPWLFSFFILLGTFIAAAFINMFAAILVFWGIIYIVAERFGFEKKDKYPMLMVLGVGFATSVGGCVMPYKPVPIVVLKAYSQAAGVPMDFFKYICFALPVTFFAVICYILICRFIFRPDMKNLKDISIDFADADALILNTKQKTAIALLAIFIFLMIAPSILPAEFLLTGIINRLGVVGCLFILLVAMHLIKFDGVPMLNCGKLAKHVNWDVVVIMAFVIPFAGLFTGDATGIKPFIVGIMQPLLAGQSEIVFIILCLLLATALTNIANNMVIGVVFTTLIITIGGGMGMAVAPVIAVLIVCVNLAIATPAASPVAAMVFSNDWCRTSDLYKYGILTVILTLALVAIAGLLWANVIY